MSSLDPIADVSFLSRSDHRVAVLETLADGPRTRSDLHEETGISQPTLGRVLGPFQDRNWVTRRGQEYALTTWGELIVADLDRLVGTVETVQRLGEVAAYLPTDEMDFDLRTLREATVTLPTPGDSFAHVRRVEELLYGAEEVRNVVPTVAPGSLDDYQRRMAEFLAGDQQVEAVVSTSVLAAMSHETVAPLMQEGLVECDRVEMYLYEGPVPCLLGVADGVAMIVALDEEGAPVGLVETENETVRSWIHARLDEYVADSTKLSGENFSMEDASIEGVPLDDVVT